MAERKPSADDYEIKSDMPEGVPEQRPALPGKGGLQRLLSAMMNSCRGIAHGAATEAAIKQELVVSIIALGLSFIIAQDIVQWLLLTGSLFMVLAAEFLNTSIERLCNHVTPRHHTQIRDIKDLASGAVFFLLIFAGLTWAGVLLQNLGLIF